MPGTRHARRTNPRRWAAVLGAMTIAAALARGGAAAGPEAVQYHVAFPSPAHHWAQIAVTFSGLPDAPLQVRMSRASPGRYAVHEFSKNVYDVQALDGAGRALTPARPDPDGWDVSGHDGTVRILYKIYGDHVDGTYLAIDTTHAHLNMPATLMWARGLQDRPIQVRFDPPQGLGWSVATQLFPTPDRWTFTAPNLQYLMDSPAELSAQSYRSFTVRNPDGRTLTIRAAVHHDATEADVDRYVGGVERIVREEGGVFGEFPEFDTGAYTFLGDYVPWGGGDGMEHRNSTVVASSSSIRGDVQDVLGTVAHEFFHSWNVERIRPKSLEPFDFERANISGELWLAEGFTQYYGDLVMHRTGLTGLAPTVGGMGELADAVLNGPGRQFHSAVEMSRLAPFTDAATAIDRTNLRNTFISYYTYGAAIALALDLSLRDRSEGRVSLDDYMRALWRTYGRPGGPQPGLVARPYTLQDARDRLADVAGDRGFADAFFDRFVEGRDVADYARLFARAGIVFRRRNPGAAWMGPVAVDDEGRVTGLVRPNTPAYSAGFDQDDTITRVDGRPLERGVAIASLLRGRKPGDRISIAYSHPDGKAGAGDIILAEDPEMEAVTVEAAGGAPTPAQAAFRSAWLGSTRP